MSLLSGLSAACSVYMLPFSSGLHGLESRLKQYLFCQVRCALHSGKPKPNGMQGDFQKSLSLFNIADLQLFRHEGFIVFFRNSVYLVFFFFFYFGQICSNALVVLSFLAAILTPWTTLCHSFCNFFEVWPWLSNPTVEE